MRFGPRGPIEIHRLGYPVLHFVFAFAILALIALLAVWLVMSIRRTQVAPAGGPALPPPATEDVAMREARMRYARGEMTREEFLQISSDLGGAPPEGRS
jgi:putative membrane protein